MVETDGHDYNMADVNTPIWMRRPEDVTNDEYASVYKSLSNDMGAHLAVKHMHFSFKGNLDFHALLFVPCVPTQNQFNIQLPEWCGLNKNGCNVHMPEWLYMFQGIVASGGSPAHISRETLYLSKILRMIKKSLVKRGLELFADIAEKDGDYKKLYERFGNSIRQRPAAIAPTEKPAAPHQPTAPCPISLLLETIKCNEDDGIEFGTLRVLLSSLGHEMDIEALASGLEALIDKNYVVINAHGLIRSM